jgi:hypothetical protein
MEKNKKTRNKKQETRNKNKKTKLRVFSSFPRMPLGVNKKS